MSELRNVVVVGAGPYSGGKAASQLASSLPSTHRVVLIDSRDFAYVTGIAARAAVVPGWEKDVVFPIAGIFPEGSRHVLLKAMVTAFDNDSVTLDREVEGFGKTIQADAIVLATASTYSYPATVDLPSIEAVRAKLVHSQQQIAAAESFLIVGGGAYGVEMAGEIADQFKGKGKSITIVTSASSIIPGPFPDKLRNSLARQLTQRGVKVIYNDRVDDKVETGPVAKRTFTTRNGVQIEADYVVFATGSKPNASLAEPYPELLTKAGRFRSKPTFQLDSPKFDHVFAIGDTLDIEGRDMTRTGAAATFQLSTVSKNVVSLVKGGKLSEYKAGAEPLFVSVGPSGGAATLFGWTLGSFLTRQMKSKDLLKGQVHAQYQYKPQY